jgi:outer membrane biosynthesis protein TonB
VLVNATIGKDGIPKNLTVIKGDQRLIAAALAAIGQWHYRPATLAGEPIETQIEITIDFHLK